MKQYILDEIPAYTEKTAEPSPKRSKAPYAIVLVVLAALTLGAIWPAQKAINGRISLMKAEIVQYLEAQTNRSISFSSVSPSVFRFLEIRNMKIYKRGEEAVELLTIARVRVYYNIFKLLRGNPANAFTRISIENTTVTIDIEKDQDLVDFFTELTGRNNAAGTGAGIDTAGLGDGGMNLDISGRNLSLHLKSAQGGFVFDELFFDLQPGAADYAIKVKGKAAAGQLSFMPDLQGIKADMLLSGDIGRSFENALLKLTISRMESGLFKAKDQTFQISFHDELWSLRKIQDSLPVDFVAYYDPAIRQARFTALSEKFALSSLLEAGESLPGIGPWLDTEITGTTGLTYDLNTQAVFIDASLNAVLINDALPADLNARVEFSGTQNKISFTSLSINSDIGNMAFAGDLDLQALYPDGILTLDKVTFPLNRPITGKAHFSRNRDGFRVFADSLYIGNEQISNVDISFTGVDDSIDFRLLCAIDPANPESTVFAEGSLLAGESNVLEVSADIGTAGFNKLYRLALDQPPPESLGILFSGMDLSAEIFLRTDFSIFSFSLPSFVASNADGTRKISLLLSGNNSNLNLSQFDILWDGYTVSAQGTAEMVSDGGINFTTSFNVLENIYNISGLYLPGTGLRASGDYGLDVRLGEGRNGYDFSIGTTRLPVSLSGKTYDASLNISGLYKSLEDLEVKIKESTISPVPFLPSLESSLTISAQLSGKEGIISGLQLSDEFSVINGSGSFTYDLANRDQFTASLLLTDEIGVESYDINIDVQDGIVQDGAEIKISQAPLLRFAEIPVSGKVTGTITASGPLSKPDFGVQVTMDEGLMNSVPVSFQASARMNADTATIESFSLNYLNYRFQSGSGMLNLSTGNFNFAVDYSGVIQFKAFSTRFGIDGTLLQKLSRNALSGILTSDFSATLGARDIDLGGEVFDDWVFAVSQDRRIVTFEGGPTVNGIPGNSISGSFKDDGSFLVKLEEPLALGMSAVGVVNKGKIEADLSNVRIDMAGIESVITIPFFNITAGEARGNLHLSGALNDPDLTGELFGRNLLARIPLSPDVIGPFIAQLSFTGKSLVLEDTIAPIGASIMQANAVFVIDHWLPYSFVVNASTIDETGIHLLYQFSDIDVDGYAVGEIAVIGEPLVNEVTGTFVVHNATLTIGEKRKPGKVQQGLIVDTTLITGKRVSFLWPTKNFPILRTSAEAGQTIRIKSDDLAGTYSITGDIGIRGGEIFYVQRNFYIKSGQIRFNEDQRKFDPVITARAEARDITDTGEDLKIFLVMHEQPFSQFKPRFESDPPMTSQEIVARLGASIFGEITGDSQLGLSSAFMLTSDILGRFGLFRSVERRIRDLLGLDLFSIRTHIIQNIVNEQVFAGLGPDSDKPPSAGRYLDNTTLFLGKYFGNDLFVEARVRLRTNDALLATLDTSDDLFIDSEIRLEWKTPLFLMELSLLPDFADPFSSITSAAFGLSWGFSY